MADLRAITAPTLIIGGGLESSIPRDKLADVAARIPRCDLVTIPAGHQVHENRPAEFTDTVRRWRGPAGRLVRLRVIRRSGPRR